MELFEERIIHTRLETARKLSLSVIYILHIVAYLEEE